MASESKAPRRSRRLAAAEEADESEFARILKRGNFQTIAELAKWWRNADFDFDKDAQRIATMSAKSSTEDDGRVWIHFKVRGEPGNGRTMEVELQAPNAKYGFVHGIVDVKGGLLMFYPVPVEVV